MLFTYAFAKGPLSSYLGFAMVVFTGYDRNARPQPDHFLTLVISQVMLVKVVFEE